MAKQDISVSEVLVGDRVHSFGVFTNKYGGAPSVSAVNIVYIDGSRYYQIELDEGAEVILSGGWSVTVDARAMAWYYFNNHPAKHDKLYTSGRLFDNARTIVGDDGTLYKSPAS